MSETLTHSDIERAESLLRSMMPHQFTVTYIPDMPRRDGTRFRWFQVVFTVGPGDATSLRSQVHSLFPAMLSALSLVSLATQADLISLRARRYCPDTKILDPTHPVMFIEADWAASAFRAMQGHGDFSTWAGDCLTYRNHFERDDPFTRPYEGQVIG